MTRAVFLAAICCFVLLGADAFRQQSVGVRGRLMCGTRPLNNTQVKLWSKNKIGTDDQIGAVKTDATGNYQLDGGVGGLLGLNVHLKVYHDCNDGIKVYGHLTSNDPHVIVAHDPMADCVGLRSRAYLLVAGFVLLVLAAVLITAQFHKTSDEDENRDEEAWETLANELDDGAELAAALVVSQSTTTLVTSFYNIRNSSEHSIQERQAMFVPIAMLKLPMVVFTDEESADFIQEIRESAGYANFTKIYVTSIRELPLYSRYHLIRDVMRPTFVPVRESNSSSSSSSSSESVEQEEDEEDGGISAHFTRALTDAVYQAIVNNSRPYFIVNATTENPFNSTQFAWIDADYGDGNMTHFPQTFEWQPEFIQRKITVIKMTPRTDPVILYTRSKLLARRSPVIDPRFIAGHPRTLKRLQKLFEEQFLETLLVAHRVDPIEVLLIELIRNHSELFNVVQGEWFSAFFVIN